MKPLWLSLMAATLAFAPITVAYAQDASGSTPAAAADEDDDDDDDDDDDAAGGSESAAMVPTADQLNIPQGSELMPASALNGDQIGLPPATLSSQIVTPLILGKGGEPFAVSHNDIYLRSNQAYRWDITSEGDVEYKFNAPGFFRNVWMNQIVIDDLEIHMAGAPAWLEYDAHGTISVSFQTIRPGRYEWYVEGLEGDQDMKGTITVVP
ncbi:hypothetical protein [Aurantimonas sp. HBX-1]|uniref:hypothetical protein n=1 Tax=Aurantimonas sp. HBX-1 TaxID=2906072 RepID=UPI001F3B32B2|nr:hypothetical protein [Aurantimonas sp. HBX-1]UIJ72253.1 hypothetical protein LXB15_00875 [Aurantimonas sp. HBX-1]